MDREFPDEWTQEQFLREKERLEKEGVKVLLVDTILSPIEKADTVVYNPFELQKESEGSVFVFYCDSGKATHDRLKEYRAKFPKYHCLSLRGGRGYWRKNMQLLPEIEAADELPKGEGEDYTEHLDRFVKCLDEERFYDAHEALEEVWFPRRFEDDMEMKLVKGFINAAVSFELTKRGRQNPATKAWGNYEKYRPLLDAFASFNTPYYRRLALRVEAMRKVRES
jgi:Domain of unknown function (DUF309)